ncbi:hypothetical protein DES44_2937 [Roseateles depolymerans]|uniref:ORF077 protein n=1 Tax=Roseateles depolymerans TaxID=76731 RepID=Q9F209_9BURK|nr:hypothetical protein RD2015_1046 [Roseateles depolymerans]REG14441.1 hypothetical protein DES44_2937 [Roseateles depolymerans]BAB19669.1 ORF077 [Roseateles depolymerans]
MSAGRRPRSGHSGRSGRSGRTFGGSHAGLAHWPRQLAARLWSALCETGATVALQHGITMVKPQTLTDSPVHRAGETA